MFRSLFVSIQYITYPVLTSTNFYPFFKGRDTAIFNFSTYHVFMYGTVHWIYPYLIPQSTTLRYYQYTLFTVFVINHNKNGVTFPPLVHMYIWWILNKIFLSFGRTPPPMAKHFMLTKTTSGNWEGVCTKRIGYHSIEYPDKT